MTNYIMLQKEFIIQREQYKKDYENSPISRSKWSSLRLQSHPRESPQNQLLQVLPMNKGGEM